MKNTKKAKCKTCHKTFIPRYRNSIKISALCDSCVKNKDAGKKKLSVVSKKKKKSKKTKKPTLKKLTEKLDKVFSHYIRLSSADKMGYITCACCKKRIDWKESQNMHYISRSHRATRWLELNCHAGCVGCNVFQHGNYPAYTQFYLDNYGVEVLQSLLDLKNIIKKHSTKDLEDLIEYYDKKIKDLSTSNT